MGLISGVKPLGTVTRSNGRRILAFFFKQNVKKKMILHNRHLNCGLHM